MPLPAPTGAIPLDQLIVAPPGSRVATLKSVNMQIQPGEVIGVVSRIV